ncbi:NADH dehydrogenase (ubiquinone) complex I, assembly factor 6-like isoform X2 [Ctenocephalides felis]|uniref:NADH dehydrogenase (ubiquinone) complex I, assembly factor 6-like isoform X2 n=1 Tax=Ctenocephalides felis TaxID=7515 RepID=UPI000E6E5976|nr:NADH dehydrogenase (ubiquinone) complex I, assembly factor 6-like isoform X2 [Ctenocephalides felis]
MRKAVKSHKLTKSFLKRLLQSRELRLLKSFCVTTEDLLKYSEDSVSCVYYLALEGCGVKNVHADHAASHLGKAQGIANMLRSLAITTESRSVFLPQQILMKHGLSQEQIIRKQDSKGSRDAIFEIASEANYHLEKARELTKSVPKEARPVLLPAAAIANYLERLRRADFRVFDDSLRQRYHMLPIAIYWNKLRRKY